MLRPASRARTFSFAVATALTAVPAMGADAPIAQDDGSVVLRGIAEISAGAEHTCARMTNGTVRCWGRNDFGQLGTTAGQGLLPTTVPGVAHAVEVSAGSFHTCARIAGGEVVCWGQDVTYSFPKASGPADVPPRARRAMRGAVQVAAGSGHTCWRLANGEVRCSALGNMQFIGTKIEGLAEIEGMRIAGFPPAASLSVSGPSCILAVAGSLHCWGQFGWGEVGTGVTNQALGPSEVTAMEGAVEVTNGGGHTCARTAAGDVFCWGYNGQGQLGDGTMKEKSLPVRVPGLTGVVQIAAGGHHTCARLADRRVMCWGEIADVPNSTFNERRNLFPAEIPGAYGARALSLGGGHTCALFEGGVARCWGLNSQGQLGEGTKTNQDEPTAVLERARTAPSCKDCRER